MAEDLGKRIGAFGQYVWKKAQGAYDIVSINSDVAAKSRDLADVYTEIGRAYCAAHPGGTANEFPALCEKAAALEKEIAALNDTVLHIRGRVRCPACGEEAPGSAAFCPACGAKLAPREPDEEPACEAAETRVCRACGAALEASDVFCPACGAKQAD